MKPRETKDKACSKICVRRDALVLFGLNEDRSCPMHITGAGVLRARLGDHLEHRVNHEARAADRTQVPAEVIQVALHEVDKVDSVKDESGGDASG